MRHRAPRTSHVERARREARVGRLRPERGGRETGTTNGVFTPDQFERLRGPLHAAPLLEIAGPVQNVDGVIHVRVREVRPLASGEVPASHDYH